MAMMCGGTGDVKPADAEVQELCDNLRSEMEGKAARNFTECTALHYKTQVVAGTNYFVKVHTGDEKYLHARIYKPLPHTGAPAEVHSVQDEHKKDTPVEYFG